MLIPASINHLPIGGVSALSASADIEVRAVEDALLSGDFDAEEFEPFDINMPTATAGRQFLFDDAWMLLLSMFGSVLLMLPIAWMYKAIHTQGEYDHSLDETTLILPAVVAGIVMVVQHSLALAFSLAGIVAGVQFRRALSDTFDTLFIFVAIAVGIAAGIQALDIAAALTVFFCYSTLLVCMFGDGLESQHTADKKRAKALRKSQHQTETDNADNAGNGE